VLQIAQLTDRERRAIRAVIEAGPSANPWRSPIQAVDAELQVITTESTALIEDLHKRDILRLRASAVNRAEGPEQSAKSWWAKGDSLPTTPGCVYHHGLTGMVPTVKTISAGIDQSVMDGWSCELRTCSGFYVKRRGYHKQSDQGRIHSELPVTARNLTRCRFHGGAVWMFAFEESDGVIAFACPEPACTEIAFVPRVDLGGDGE